MNGITWMIYAADVCEKIGITAAVLGFGGAVAGGFVGALIRDVGESPETGKSIHKWTLRICPPLMVLFAITPSQNTVYAMAASELGEKVVQSETAGKAMEALNAWLDRQITPDKPTNGGTSQ